MTIYVDVQSTSEMLSLSLILQEQCATEHYQINIAFLLYSIIIICRVFSVICGAFSVLLLIYNLLQEIHLILQPEGVTEPNRFWIPYLQWFMSGVCSTTLYCSRYSTPTSILSSCNFFCQSSFLYKLGSFRFLSDMCVYVPIYICMLIGTDIDLCVYM